jgi:hypothetical protein
MGPRTSQDPAQPLLLRAHGEIGSYEARLVGRVASAPGRIAGRNRAHEERDGCDTIDGSWQFEKR